MIVQNRRGMIVEIIAGQKSVGMTKRMALRGGQGRWKLKKENGENTIQAQKNCLLISRGRAGELDEMLSESLKVGVEFMVHYVSTL